MSISRIQEMFSARLTSGLIIVPPAANAQHAHCLTMLNLGCSTTSAPSARQSQRPMLFAKNPVPPSTGLSLRGEFLDFLISYLRDLASFQALLRIHRPCPSEPVIHPPSRWAKIYGISELLVVGVCDPFLFRVGVVVDDGIDVDPYPLLPSFSITTGSIPSRFISIYII